MSLHTLCSSSSSNWRSSSTPAHPRHHSKHQAPSNSSRAWHTQQGLTAAPAAARMCQWGACCCGSTTCERGLATAVLSSSGPQSSTSQVCGKTCCGHIAVASAAVSRCHTVTLLCVNLRA
jgi:hypothetical protein